MYKLNYYVPVPDKENTKEALFAIGVGRFDNYELCSWESLGEGQFKPVRNANPYLGELNVLKKVPEYKVEMICPDTLIQEAIEVLKKTHPYEEVAYEVFKMEDF